MVDVGKRASSGKGKCSWLKEEGEGTLLGTGEREKMGRLVFDGRQGTQKARRTGTGRKNSGGQ